MTDEVISDIGALELPFGRSVEVKNVQFASGLAMLRLTWREGRRFTVIDLDPQAAQRLGETMSKWAALSADDN